MEFIDKYNILYKFQSGFRKYHSTDFCLSYLTDKISKGFDSGLLTGVILIDLQKAFDTIDHNILLQKMSSLEISREVIDWYKSYLSSRKFHVNVHDKFSTSADLRCGVPQESILGPLLFLLYINDMPQAVDCDLFLYADDTCLLFQHKDLERIKEELTKNFSNICDWFVDRKLSIHFGEDKTKSILFSTKNKTRKIGTLDIQFGEIKIKQYSKVTYLGCDLDKNLFGETMALRVMNKINSRLKFMYRKNRYLTPHLKRLLCNALIQSHFDYACSAWYPNPNKTLKSKLQSFQNRFIRYCLQLDNRSQTGVKNFEKINWLPVSKRFNQYLCSNAFKFFKETCPLYFHDIYRQSGQNQANTRSSVLKLKHPLRNTCSGQKNLSYLTPIVWNSLPTDLELANSLNNFKHKLKDHFFKKLRNMEQNAVAY